MKWFDLSWNTDGEYTAGLRLSFGGGDWLKFTTKVTKSTKVEFDDLSNRVIELRETVWYEDRTTYQR